MRTFMQLTLLALTLAPLGCGDGKDRAKRDVITVEQARLALLRLVAADPDKRFRGTEGDLLEDLDEGDDPLRIGNFVCCRKDASFFITVGDRKPKGDLQDLSGRFVRDDRGRWKAVLDRETRPVCHTPKEKPKRPDLK
jgi:hypothetical protein